MKIVGLTGGIGSGKSTIAMLFKALGVPVYIADIEAKKILASSKVVQAKVISLLGAQAYSNEVPNRDYIAQLVFNDPDLLAGLNAIIHPEVHTSFKIWATLQDAPYCIKEAAILFENGGFTQCDATILVTAPTKLKIERVLSRDQTTLNSIQARMENQWEDQKKIPLANYVIENIDLTTTKNQVQKIHKTLLSTCISSL
jgi:dephospho-CoA kinase